MKYASSLLHNNVIYFCACVILGATCFLLLTPFLTNTIKCPTLFNKSHPLLSEQINIIYTMIKCKESQKARISSRKV